MKELQLLLLYIKEQLLPNPGEFETNRHTHEEKLLRFLDRYADQRPPTIDEMIAALKEEYPSLENNYELLEKGNNLRNDMIERVFSADFEPSEVKKFEAQITLFERLVAFNQTINTLLDNVSGVKVITRGKHRHSIKSEVSDTQGAAQRILTSKDSKTNEQE